jgi:hypothetical protein
MIGRAGRTDDYSSRRKGLQLLAGVAENIREESMADSMKGGFHIGTVGKNASFSAGGDMVGGDKIIQGTTTTVNNGFKQDDDRLKFLEQIDELRTMLRELQTKVAEAPGPSQDAKDEIAAEVLQQVDMLRKTKDEAATLPTAQPPSAGTLQLIQTCLESTGTVLDKFKSLSDQALGIGEVIEPYISKALPILLSARHLFGLP